MQVVILPQPRSGVQCNEHSMVNPDHLIIKVGMASQEAVLCSKRFRTWLTDRGSVDYHELSCIACLNMGACIALVNLVATPRKHSFANSSGSHCGTIAPTINLTHSNIASDPATLEQFREFVHINFGLMCSHRVMTSSRCIAVGSKRA